jgi:hypothetical protein
LVSAARDGGRQFRRQLALFLDRGRGWRHGGLPVRAGSQAFFEIAQLRVVEVVGDFLAIAGDEGHGRAFVEQLHGGGNLLRAHAEFVGDALGDVWSLADMGVKRRKGRAP